MFTKGIMTSTIATKMDKYEEEEGGLKYASKDGYTLNMIAAEFPHCSTPKYICVNHFKL